MLCGGSAYFALKHIPDLPDRIWKRISRISGGFSSFTDKQEDPAPKPFPADAAEGKSFPAAAAAAAGALHQLRVAPAAGVAPAQPPQPTSFFFLTVLKAGETAYQAGEVPKTL